MASRICVDQPTRSRYSRPKATAREVELPRHRHADGDHEDDEHGGDAEGGPIGVEAGQQQCGGSEFRVGEYVSEGRCKRAREEAVLLNVMGELPRGTELGSCRDEKHSTQEKAHADERDHHSLLRLEFDGLCHTQQGFLV